MYKASVESNVTVFLKIQVGNTNWEISCSRFLGFTFSCVIVGYFVTKIEHIVLHTRQGKKKVERLLHAVIIYSLV